MDLLPHQIEANKFLLEKKYCILADSMGLGKTLSALSASVDCTYLLVICPAYLKANWAREVKKWNFQKPLFICSYDSISSGKSEVYFQTSSHIIIDEAHFAKNITANRTKAIHHYIKKSKPTNVYLLSGTPSKGRVPELYSLLMICSYGNKETAKLMTPYYNYFSFSDKFSIRTVKNIRGRKIISYTGHRNLPELKAIMATCYLRRLKMEVDLPSMRDIKIYLDLENDTNDTDIDTFISTGKVSQSMASRKAENALIKAPHTAKFCAELVESGQVEQIVIFCDHINSTGLIANKLGVPFITGHVSLENRDKIVQDFTSGKLQYLVTTIGTSSTGLNLVNTHVMVFNSFPWVSGDLEQAKKRINRIGQVTDCIYYYMIDGSVDDRILNVLTAKQKTLDKVL
jgi:SNF2 family DNA or RNA helicase